MAAPILDRPPNDGHLWIPPGALGPDFVIKYTLGRNNGGYLDRKKRTAIHTHVSHIMGNGKVTPQGFANSEMPSDATLAEIATFPASNSPWGKPTLLQSLPLDIIGAGSVAGGATGLTEESAQNVTGDANVYLWPPDHIALKVALTAWLIRNPLAAAGDRKWRMMDIRYQITKSPYGPTPELGGLGDHTMWGTCGVQAGGTNPWSLYCKSCPGWARRGTQRNVQFPNSVVTDIPSQAGNFRDYYERVGVALMPGGGDPEPPEDDMTPEDHAAIKAQFDSVLNQLAAKPSLSHIHQSSVDVVNGSVTGTRHTGLYEGYLYPKFDAVLTELAAIRARLDALEAGDGTVPVDYQIDSVPGRARPVPPA